MRAQRVSLVHGCERESRRAGEHDANYRHAAGNDVGYEPRLAPGHHFPAARNSGIYQVSPLVAGLRDVALTRLAAVFAVATQPASRAVTSS